MDVERWERAALWQAVSKQVYAVLVTAGTEDGEFLFLKSRCPQGTLSSVWRYI